jgi:hypothetical protein
MKLLAAVEQGETGIVGDKIDFRFLVASQHDDVLPEVGLPAKLVNSKLCR